MDFDWKKALADYAPAIVGAVATGGTGPLVAAAIKAAADHFGVEATEPAVAKAVQAATPEQMLAIKEADYKFAQLALEETKSYLADGQNARAMQVAALGQDDPLPKRFVYYLATGWSCFAAVYIFWITFADIPPHNVRFADTILGFLLGTVIAMILQFFFGSSQGSVKSAQALRDLARGAAK